MTDPKINGPKIPNRTTPRENDEPLLNVSFKDLPFSSLQTIHFGKVKYELGFMTSDNKKFIIKPDSVMTMAL